MHVCAVMKQASTGERVAASVTLVQSHTLSCPCSSSPPGLHQSPLLPKQGQKPTSPIPNLSPEKGSLSPSKSPPHHPLKGFNPNAPTFIPMGLQNMQRPAKVSHWVGSVVSVFFRELGF